MERPIDFSKLTIEELTPIVSMRPGKEYTREELKEARAAFMQALGCTSSAPDTHSADTEAPREEETTHTEMPLAASTVEASVSSVETKEISALHAEPSESPSSEMPLENEVPQAEESLPIAAAAEEVLASANETETHTEETSESAAIATDLEEEPEAFILKAESRLARFLYILYAYVLLPVLAAESLIFLLGSVATAIMVRDVPFVFVHILAAVLYTMIVSIAWHQFLHRSKLGLLLNRSLIGVCIFRGFSMTLSGTSLPVGIIYIALSLLYLVFFVAYDSTFVIPSQD